jgi:5-dehydro-4-deoxyglucarate dehydratase
MTSEVLLRRLRGVLGFPVTPFAADLSLDLAGLASNVDAMARHPFCALVAAGGAAEVYSLRVAEILDVVRVTVETVAGRMPVLAGVGFNLPVAADLARQIEKTGAGGLLVLPPYYVNAPEEGLLEYYRRIGEASDLPLIVYTRDWAVFTPEFAERLADRVPSIAAWKDGQGDMRRLQRLMARLGDRFAWIGGAGDDLVPAYFAIGVQAFTSSLSNVAPRLSVALAEAGRSRDFTRLDDLVKRYVAPFFAIRDRLRGYEVALVKRAMEILGAPAGPVRPPLVDCGPRETEELSVLLGNLRDML